LSFFSFFSYLNQKNSINPINQINVFLKVDKLTTSLRDFLTLADDDINDNWQIYRERFLRGEFP